jgi:hypothetical protein
VHETHVAAGMLWSMIILGTMPFVLVGLGALLYFRTLRSPPAAGTGDLATGSGATSPSGDCVS